MSPSITDAGREHPWFRGGKADPRPDTPRLRLAAFLRPAAVSPPDEVDWCSTVTDWGMLGNDRYGDCVFAGQAHETLARTTLAQHPYRPTEAETLHQYSLVAGFNPNDPDSDQGAVIQDALSFWRRNGFPAGHTDLTVAAFAEVDLRNPDEILAALWLFGSLSAGLQVPDFALDQHDRGEVWDVQPGGRNLGGHAVHVARARREGSGLRLWVITWGGVQEVSWSFWLKYFDEAWCSITQEWLIGAGEAPNALNLVALGEQFAALTGEPDPFPAPPAPVPDPPAPDPTPTPSPVTDVPTAADRALWTHVQHWIHQPHLMPSARTVARELRTWAAAKGLTAGGS